MTLCFTKKEAEAIVKYFKGMSLTKEQKELKKYLVESQKNNKRKYEYRVKDKEEAINLLELLYASKIKTLQEYAKIMGKYFKIRFQ